MKSSLLLAALAAAQVFAMGRKPAGGSMKELMAVSVETAEWRGSLSPEAAPMARVVKTQPDWERLWEALRKPAPDVDFSKHFAVAVFAGSRPTGGYGIEFLEPVSDGKTVVIRYKVHPPRGFVTQAFTQPYSIRIFNRTTLEVSTAEVREPQ